jgi:hypothetical protein
MARSKRVLGLVVLAFPAGVGFAGEPAPYAWWRLEETQSTLAWDDSGGYYGVYLGGPSLGLPGSVDPCRNLAVGFDGVDDRVLMSGQSAALNMGTDSFTVVAWFRRADASSDWMKIVNKGLTLAGTPANAGYALRVRDGVIEFSVSDGASIRNAIAPEPAPGVWHFVAGVLDRDAGEARLYLDPVDTAPSAFASVAGLGSVDTNIEFAIAALDRSPAGDPSEFFRGEIDEVRLYRAALTPAEVSAMYAARPCLADLAEPAGLLDLVDVTAFVGAFLSGQSEADLAPPCGVFDLGDVGAFVSTFIGGCE